MPKSKNHGRFPCSIPGCFAVANHLSSMCRHKWGHLPQRLLPACRGHLANGLPCPVRYQGRADTMKRHWLTHHTNEGPWQPDRYPPFEDLWKLVKDGEIVLTPPSKYQASTTTDGEDDEPSVEPPSSMTTSLATIEHDSGVGPIRRRRATGATRMDPIARPQIQVMRFPEEADEQRSPALSTVDAPPRTRYPLLPAGNYNVVHPPLVPVPTSHVREHHHRHRRTSSASTNATGVTGGLGLLSRAAAMDHPPLPPLIPSTAYEYTHCENDGLSSLSKRESKPFTGNYLYGHKKGSPPGPGYTPASIPTSELSLLSHPPTDTIFSSSSPPALTSSPVSVLLKSPASVLRSPLSEAAAPMSPVDRMSPFIHDAYVEDGYIGGGFPPMRVSPMSA